MPEAVRLEGCRKYRLGYWKSCGRGMTSRRSGLENMTFDQMKGGGKGSTHHLCHWGGEWKTETRWLDR